MGLISLFAFVGFIITMISAFAMAFFWNNGLTQDFDTYYTYYFASLYTMIGSAVVLMIMSFWINFSFARKAASSKLVIFPYIIFALVMGVFLSTFIIWIDISTIFVALGTTIICFGMMALVGYFSKVNLAPLAFVAMFIMVGALILSVVNTLLYLFGDSIIGVNFELVDWIVSFAFLIAIMLITCFDFYRIKRIIEAGQMTGNLALYCGFMIYVDFIYMFMYLLTIWAKAKR